MLQKSNTGIRILERNRATRLLGIASIHESSEGFAGATTQFCTKVVPVNPSLLSTEAEKSGTAARDAHTVSRARWALFGDLSARVSGPVDADLPMYNR
jgi:hypothetical protein